MSSLLIWSSRGLYNTSSDDIQKLCELSDSEYIRRSRIEAGGFTAGVMYVLVANLNLRNLGESLLTQITIR